MTSVQVAETVKELQLFLEKARISNLTIGFVPTMGFLHEGHASLINTSTKQRDVTVVSIYVNPLQFDPDEDFDKYPKDISSDLDLCNEHGVDIVFMPSEEEMKPFLSEESLKLRGIVKIFEGESRPVHFQGVATVVKALFEIVGSSYAFFGEKDFQQLVLVKQLVDDYLLPVQVIGCPIIRENDGLAKSSRNVYLDSDEREQSAVIYQSLKAGAEAISKGETSIKNIEQLIKKTVETSPLANIDYVAVVDPLTFEIPNSIKNEVRLLVACNFGQARLIDNILAQREVVSS
ncbi:MAG TPA: pantoate--beta-alanine ligase [Acidimicrobiales bacterium]|nr:pantoate--beta-alanine ligase [Acidimicrobiales bacterium]